MNHAKVPWKRGLANKIKSFGCCETVIGVSVLISSSHIQHISSLKAPFHLQRFLKITPPSVLKFCCAASMKKRRHCPQSHGEVSSLLRCLRSLKRDGGERLPSARLRVICHASQRGPGCEIAASIKPRGCDGTAPWRTGCQGNCLLLAGMESPQW